MAHSEFEYLIRPENLVVHQTRSEGRDSDFLKFSIRIFDFRQGVPESQRLLWTSHRERQIASSVNSGETIGITKSVEGEHVNDMEMWFRLRPTDVVTVDYLVVNFSREIHDPQAQRDRWRKTIVAYERGIALGGTIASVSLLPFGVVPGALTAAITGGITTALHGLKEILGLFGGGEAVNCDGPVMAGVFSFFGSELEAETDNLDQRIQIVKRHADQGSPDECGGTPDSELTVSITRTAATSFVAGASPDSWVVRALTGAPDTAWHGMWGDQPELSACRIRCGIFPSPDFPSADVRRAQIRLLDLISIAEASGHHEPEIAAIRQHLPDRATLLEDLESSAERDPLFTEGPQPPGIVENEPVEAGDLPPGFEIFRLFIPVNVSLEERTVASGEALSFSASNAFPITAEGSLLSDDGLFPLVETIHIGDGAELQLYAAYSTAFSNHVEEYRLQYRRVGPDGILLNQQLRHSYQIS
jgi:hypothetical protein